MAKMSSNEERQFKSISLQIDGKLYKEIKEAIKLEDSDLSKYIRNSIRDRNDKIFEVYGVRE